MDVTTSQMKKKLCLVEHKVPTKLIIMSAWTAMMILYFYCDFLSLFKPGTLESMIDGRMGLMAVSQMSLFTAGVLMAIPTLMILVSTLAPAHLNRILNMVASVVYVLVNIGNLIGETWGYYYLFGLLELGVVVFIFITALRWPKETA